MDQGSHRLKFSPVTFRQPKIQGNKKKASKQANTQAREQKKHASKNSAVGKELNISYREYLAGQFENGDFVRQSSRRVVMSDERLVLFEFHFRKPCRKLEIVLTGAVPRVCPVQCSGAVLRAENKTRRSSHLRMLQRCKRSPHEFRTGACRCP